MANVNSWIKQGGYVTNPKLSEDTFKVAQPMMYLRRFVKKLRVKGKMGGDKVNFPKFGNLDQEYATTPLVEGVPMGESLQSVTQGELTLDEWGRALPFSHKIEVLSDYNLDPGYREALGDHFAKTYNYRVGAKLKSTFVKVVPNATSSAGTGETVTTSDTNKYLHWTTDGTIVSTASRTLEAADFAAIKGKMVDTWHIPPFKGPAEGPEFEYIVVSTETAIQKYLADAVIREDLRYADMGAGKNAARISGKFPVWNGFLFVKDNQAISSVLGATAVPGETIIMGRAPVVEVVAEAMNIRVKTPDDYGRSKGLAWYAIDGLALTWGDNSTDITNAQVSAIHVTSV